MREMKDSGVPWIGKIPVNWKTIRLKYISKLINGFAFKSQDLKADGYYKVVRIGDLNNNKINSEDCLGVDDVDNYRDYKVYMGDVLVALSGATVGKVAFVDNSIECYINQRVGIIRSFWGRFIFHIFTLDKFIENLKSCLNDSAQPNLSIENIGGISIPIYDKNTIKKIVRYLDDKCENIDNIIAREQSVIEKLQEYKKALITEAVTKGLNPNVNMKESGLDWIGKVPETYSLIKLKFLGEYFNGLTYSPDNLTDVDEGVLVLRSSNIKNGKLVLDDNVYVNVDIPRYLVKKNDILICSRNGSRNLVGKNILLSEDIHAYFGAFMMIFRLNSEVYSKWVYYVLNSNLFLAYLGSFFSSTINQLTGKDFGNIIIPICDVEEAKQITECLDEKCSNIDSIILKKQFTIDKLIEYKQSLIYEVVTGKKEVPHV